MPKITKETRNSTRSFFGGAGSIIPFKPKATEEVQEKSPAKGKDHEDKMGEQDDLYSPIPFDAFPGSDPDPEVMEAIRKEVVAERIARAGGDKAPTAGTASKLTTE